MIKITTICIPKERRSTAPLFFLEKREYASAAEFLEQEFAGEMLAIKNIPPALWTIAAKNPLLTDMMTSFLTNVKKVQKDGVTNPRVGLMVTYTIDNTQHLSFIEGDKADAAALVTDSREPVRLLGKKILARGD